MANKAINELPVFKIKQNTQGIFPLTIFTAAFTAVTVLLYLNNNGAFIITGFLTVFLFVIFVSVIFKLLFNKLIIYKNGFYFKTNMFNGKFYKFNDILKFWVSYGKTSNGTLQNCLNFKTIDTETKNISVLKFLYCDFLNEDAVDFLSKNIKPKAIGSDFQNYCPKSLNTPNNYDFIITGKENSGFRIFISFACFLIFLYLSINTALHNKINNSNTIYFIGFFAITLLLFIALTKLTVRYFCFKILIYKNGFYLKTNMFNGKFYNFNEVKSCKITTVSRLLHSKSGFEIFYRDYCIIDLKNKKTLKIQFEKYLYYTEFDVLKERSQNNSKAIAD